MRSGPEIPEILRPAAAAAMARLAPQLGEWSVEARQALERALAASPFLRDWCERLPQQVDAVLRLNQPPPLPAPAAADFDAALRRGRNARMARIAWREISAQCTPEETATALSTLAADCLERALAHHWQALVARHGQPLERGGEPLRFCVLGLGKLGGGELNFSSDVDLIFAYSGAGQSDGERSLGNEAFAVRLGQRIVASLQEVTAEGFVFRVDLRLRPFGEQGPIAHSFAAMEEYYEGHGRDWERYAWIKARPVAGDLQAGQDLIDSLQPFVYRKYLDFGAVSALREMKAQIDEQVRRRGVEQDIKLGWGGIREVEFIAQVFQLVRGGAEPGLRSHSLMQAFAAIERLGLYPAEHIDELRSAYWFLRRVENCWQAQRDQQSHVLPHHEEPRMALACALAYPDWMALEADLQTWRARVHAQFSALFAEPESDEPGAPLVAWWQDPAAGEPPSEWLPDTLMALRQRAARRLSRPADQAAVGRLLGLLWPGLEDAELAARIAGVLEAVIGRSNYVTLLLDNAVARKELIHLCRVSAWLAEEIRRFPAVLSELLDPVRLYAPDERAVLRDRLAENLAGLAEDDIEARLDVLRRTRHAAMLRIAAADVSAALPIMRVSDRLSELAEEIVSAALSEAMLQMRQRFPELPEPAFCVIAYGKLGGLELGYSSDLDLVFVYDGEQQGLPLDPPVFYTRLAQKLIHCLTTPTGAGIAYEIDTRLRPSGASGLLVTSIAGLADYQRERAWTWEHQALIRARPVAGSPELMAAFEALRAEVLMRARDRAELLAEVADMREKMRRELGPTEGRFDPKHSPGGIVDIEFLVQFAVLAHAAEHPGVARYPDVIRILESLQAVELISAEDLAELGGAYRRMRAALHGRFLTGSADADAELAAIAERTAARLARVQQALAAG